LTSPAGNGLEQFRANLLAGVSGIRHIEVRHMGKVCAGICEFDEFRHQTKKARRRGTVAGSIATFCSGEALAHSGISLEQSDRSRVGVYIGITEHGTLETFTEIQSLREHNDEIRFWSHHQNPRSIANNPAGEVTLNLKITGPHYTLGGACAAGNIGIIHGMQMLLQDEVDIALSGGVSECAVEFGVFAGFKAEGELAEHEDPAQASRPFDLHRTGVVVSNGGGMLVLERLDQARKRNARIYAELAGYCINSDASDYVLPNAERQAECMEKAIRKAGIQPENIDIINTHATGTRGGDIVECKAIHKVFGEKTGVFINNTKSFIGHTMGAAGALELAGNLPSFTDRIVHPTINIEELDPECNLPNLLIGKPREKDKVDYILNNSFGMLGLNSTLIVKRYVP
jgi:3-oxoacyl-[acyl-carrier-protein] synthase II